MEVFDFIASLAGIVGAIFALLAWLKAKKVEAELETEKKRKNQKVAVFLEHDGIQSLKLPVDMLRSELTRAEVLGRLGMLPMKNKGQRFSIKYLSKPEFLKQISQIIEGKGEGLLTIPCNEEEFNQFDLPTP